MENSDRKVITRSPSHGVHAICAGGLLDRHVEAESRLEAHFIRRTALIPSHPKIIHQPFKAPISPKGYTPDFLVFFPRSGFKAVVEVKISSRVDDEYLELFDLAANFFRHRGYVLYVVTDLELMLKEIHRRAKLLTRYAKDHVAEQISSRVMTLLTRSPKGIPLGSLARKAQIPQHKILTLIAHGVLSSGPRLQTDASAIVFQPTTEESDDEVFFCRWFGVEAWCENI